MANEWRKACMVMESGSLAAVSKSLSVPYIPVHQHSVAFGCENEMAILIKFP